MRKNHLLEKGLFLCVTLMMLFTVCGADKAYASSTPSQIDTQNNYMYQITNNGTTLEISRASRKNDKVYIPKNCFAEMSWKTDITRIILPEQITRIEANAFSGFSNLTALQLPANIEYIGESAFYGDDKLTITYPLTECAFQKVTTGNSIGTYNVDCVNSHHFAESSSSIHPYGAWEKYIYKCSDCDATYEVSYTATAPTYSISNFTSNSATPISISLKRDGMNITRVNTKVFMGSQVREVLLPDTIQTIEEAAFKNCRSLSLVNIPPTTTSIGREAFYNCYKLKELKVYSQLALIDSNAIGMVDNHSVDGFVLYGHNSTARIYANSKGLTYIDQHTVVADPKVEPTCAYEGKTAGFHCSDCGEIIVAQKAIERLPHSYSDYVSNNDATTERDGTKSAICRYCGAVSTITDPGTKLPKPANDGNGNTDNGNSDTGNTDNGNTDNGNSNNGNSNTDNGSVNNNNGNSDGSDSGDTGKGSAKKQTIKLKKFKKEFDSRALNYMSYSFKIKATAKTKLSYKIIKGSKKYIKVSSTGKVTLKKGCKRGVYRIRITAKKTSAYKAAKRTVSIYVY